MPDSRRSDRPLIPIQYPHRAKHHSVLGDELNLRLPTGERGLEAHRCISGGGDHVGSRAAVPGEGAADERDDGRRDGRFLVVENPTAGGASRDVLGVHLGRGCCEGDRGEAVQGGAWSREDGSGLVRCGTSVERALTPCHRPSSDATTGELAGS